MCETPKVAKRIQQTEQILRILSIDYLGELSMRKISNTYLKLNPVFSD